MPTFQPVNTAKIEHFKFKKNALTHPEQPRTTLKKWPGQNHFFTLKMVKNHPLTNVTIVKILTKNLDFRGQFSTFGIEYTSPCGSIKSITMP